MINRVIGSQVWFSSSRDVKSSQRKQGRLEENGQDTFELKKLAKSLNAETRIKLLKAGAAHRYQNALLKDLRLQIEGLTILSNYLDTPFKLLSDNINLPATPKDWQELSQHVVAVHLLNEQKGKKR